MKILITITILFLAPTFSFTNAQNQLKRYQVKSGIVEYKTTISGKVMGSTINGSGSEKLYFKDWGAMELKETKQTQTTTVKFFGQEDTETKTTHNIVKIDDGKVYSVDFEKEKIYLNRDMAMDMTKAFYPDADAGEAGKSMLESMGGKKTGNEKFMGYDCEVWELSGGKQWIYKGAMLKAEITMLGITTITEATSANFNTSITDKYFQLPDFPMQEQEGFMGEGMFNENMLGEDMDEEDMFEENLEENKAAMDKISKMSYEEWKRMVLREDEELRNSSEEELRETYNMMQKMLKFRTGK